MRDLLNRNYIFNNIEFYDYHLAAVANVFGQGNAIGGDFQELEDSELDRADDKKKKKKYESSKQKLSCNSDVVDDKSFNVRWYDYMPLTIDEVELLYFAIYFAKNMQGGPENFKSIAAEIQDGLYLPVTEKCQQQHLLKFIQERDAIGGQLFGDENIKVYAEGVEGEI